MGLTRQSVQRLADLLVAEGFATWEPNPRHRRAKLLQASPDAYGAVRQVAAVQHPWSSAVGDAVGATQIRRAHRTLERILEAMGEHPPAAP
jgi:DNA-binding MarR family transcriptional regulator